ncbi:MAG: R3H domain-containing nucleic acid-binding protein [Bacilli bacterium]|jgi:spoIIIJ-associated protein
MKTYVYEGKNLEELKEKALLELGKEENDVFMKSEEGEVGLFKSKKYKLEVLVKEEVLSSIKEQLLDIINKMGIEANLEAKIRDDHYKIVLFSNNNAVLIGKGGRTIESLQSILKHSFYNKTKFNINITLDVEDYKEKQLRRIKMLATNTAKEVLETGVEVKLDSMNSYERRLVHEEVSKIEGLHTISEGEEPNRYVVIKVNEK